MSRPSHRDLSIIIPARNERERLPQTVQALEEWLPTTNYQAEIIPVIQGDDGTATWLEQKALTSPHLHPILDLKGEGKGRAVQRGMLAATGEILLFIDADLSTSLKSLDQLLQIMQTNQECDIIIGSRYLPESQITCYQSWQRRLLSRFFNLLLHYWKLTSFHDTQCGCKLFRRATTSFLFEQLTIEGFAFDIELLFIAQKAGLTILEKPVIWENKAASSLSVSSNGWQALQDAYQLYRKTL